MARVQMNVMVREDVPRLIVALADRMEKDTGGIQVSKGDVVEVAIRALAKEKGVRLRPE